MYMREEILMKNQLWIIILLLPILLFGCNKSISEQTNQELNSTKSITDTSETDLNWVKVEQDIEKQKELQKQVDEGHMPGLLDSIQVAAHFVSDNLDNILTTNGDGVQINERDDSQFGKVVSYQFENSCLLELRLNRPVGSVWAVEYYRLSNCIAEKNVESNVNSNNEVESQQKDPREILNTDDPGDLQINNEVKVPLHEYTVNLNPGGHVQGYVYETFNLVKYLWAINYKSKELFEYFEVRYSEAYDAPSFQELVDMYHEYVDFTTIKTEVIDYNDVTDEEINITLSYISKKTGEKALLKYRLKNGILDESLFE